MVSKVSPSEMSINRHLEEARPMAYDEFCKVMDSNEGVLEKLSEDKRKFYKSVKELAKNIKKKGRQLYQVTARKTDDGLELITGYRRFLACTYIGRPVRYEVRQMSDSEILDLIYSENEVRRDLDPMDRAILIAKQMGRWDSDEETLLSEDEAEESSMSIAEFAEETGKNRGLIYQQLSPIRQNQTMREEFGGNISESSFQLIEQIADNESEQYTLAQALTRSSIDTHSSFHSSYKLAKKKEPDNIVNEICRKLLGVENEDVQGSYVHPDERKTKAQKLVEKKEKELRLKEEEEEERVKQRIKDKNGRVGENIPDPTDGTDTGPDMEVNTPDDDPLGHDTVGGDQSGVGVLPPKEEQPFDDDELNVTIEEGEVAQLIREESHDREVGEEEYINDIIKVHFRREGLLRDTPELQAN